MKLLRLLLLIGLNTWTGLAQAQGRQPAFRVIAFFTGRNDLAHIDFVREANQWFPQQAAAQGFAYDTTSNWQNMNAGFLARYQVVVFLDTRPEQPAQRAAFQAYMNRGGALARVPFCGVCAHAFVLPAELELVPRAVFGHGRVRGQHLAAHRGHAAGTRPPPPHHAEAAGHFHLGAQRVVQVDPRPAPKPEY